MTPDQLAQLHARAFVMERAWSVSEFASLLQSAHVQLFAAPQGFALARTVAGESELLTLAVDPAARRQGLGRRLTREWLETSQAHATEAFLEVASDNSAALGLYLGLGFAKVAVRRGYYARKNAASADAIVMRRDLTLRHHDDSATLGSESG